MTIESPIFQAVTLLCLVPAIWFAWRGGSDEGWSWPLAGLACVGPAVWAGGVLAEGWRADFSTALWTTVAATLLIFVTIAGSSDSIRRLARLVFPYAGILFVLATLSAPLEAQPQLAPDAWTFVHIVIAVLTYALITLAAVAGLAVSLKEHALKTKAPNPVISHLPSLADGEILQDRFLMSGQIVLGLGVATGIAIKAQDGAPLLQFDHKTLLTLGAFVVIGALLILRRTSGIRGLRAARYVMIAYLLVTLGYPGVKFVTDVLA